MRYLVTGGAGFIGSNTVDELVRRGHSVVVLDDLSAGKEENLAEVRNKITFIKGSITDIEVIRKAIFEAEFVIHLAARTSVPRSMKDPVETNRINIDGTLNVLVAARDAKVKRVVFAASSSAYGETPTLPKTEDMPPMPISPYGVTKYVGELYAQTFGRCFGLENVCLRYFNIFGPRQDPGSPYSGVMAKFCTAFLEETEPVIFGDGTQSRDFTFVDNAVQANLLACEAPNASGKVFNVGTGHRISLNDIVACLGKVSGKPARSALRSAARWRYSRFAGGHHSGAPISGLRTDGAIRRRPGAHLRVVSRLSNQNRFQALIDAQLAVTLYFALIVFLNHF